MVLHDVVYQGELVNIHLLLKWRWDSEINAKPTAMNTIFKHGYTAVDFQSCY
jgi:hypothetical protein